MSSPPSPEINGNPAALAFDRAVDELRRGRAVQVADGERGLVVAAIETVQTQLFARLVAASGGRAVMLVTAERAHAAGLSRQLCGAVAVAFPAETDLERLRALAGVAGLAPVDSTAFDVDAAPQCAPLAAAAFQLAKAGRLVPALIGFENDGELVARRRDDCARRRRASRTALRPPCAAALEPRARAARRRASTARSPYFATSTASPSTSPSSSARPMRRAPCPCACTRPA